MNSRGVDHATGAGTLLALARAVLDGSVSVPSAQRAQSAAQLGRLAFEGVIDDLCTTTGMVLPRARTRSRLIVLDHILPPEHARRAQAAWSGLSRACHRHAFELVPADTEIADLLEHVEALSRWSG